MCFYLIFFFSLYMYLRFWSGLAQEKPGVKPRKPVHICPVGPCVLHPEMLGLILTGSKPLVYLK